MDSWDLPFGWDGMGCPRLSHAIPMGLGDGMDSRDLPSGWDGMGCPRLSHAIPMGLGDGMDSWDHALWMGQHGTSQTIPCCPNGILEWDGQLGQCPLGGMAWDVPDCAKISGWTDLWMGRPRLSHAIPMGLGDGMDSWDVLPGGPDWGWAGFTVMNRDVLETHRTVTCVLT